MNPTTLANRDAHVDLDMAAAEQRAPPEEEWGLKRKCHAPDQTNLGTWGHAGPPTTWTMPTPDLTCPMQVFRLSCD